MVWHFATWGIQPEKDSIRVVGIGDMAGDVFGNGMLLSSTTQLVAAFNHEHIFLDPHPDPAKSYHERVRMFALPKSSWVDYDKSLISEGGGVFSRSAKAIALSDATRDMLQLSGEGVTPNQVIQAIFTMPVDL